MNSICNKVRNIMKLIVCRGILCPMTLFVSPIIFFAIFILHTGDCPSAREEANAVIEEMLTDAWEGM